ncbi:MAG: hypothetical protein Q4E73_04610 [Lachnospiraceae bacterium]|nr:hypothetical protein [Lachnospiraceae bacterium]
MQRLLSFREKVKTFVDKHNLPIRCIGKFIGAMIMLYSAGALFGSDNLLSGFSICVGISIICVFIPFSYSFIIFAIVCCIYSMTISVDVMFLLLIICLMMYIIYNRNFMQYGYLAILTFVLMPTRLSAAIPVFVGIFAGPMGIPPMLMGILIYYYAITLNEIMNNVTRNVGTYQLYQLVLDSIISNKEIMLCLLSFLITLLVARQLYRAKFNFAWQVSIPISGIVYAVIYLYGSFLLEIESSITDTIISFILSMVILEILQFFQNVVDYSRVENLQFEDDEYYYYVKAVPKIKIMKEEFNIKKINTQRNSLIHRKNKKE